MPEPTATAMPAPTATPQPTATPPPPTPTEGPSIKRGGTLIRNERRDPPHLDPHAAVAAIDLFFISQLYSTLLMNPVGTEFVCDLCESWEYTGDGTTAVFNLRDDPTFADGSPVEAQDVVYSLRKMVGLVPDEAKSTKCGAMSVYLAEDNPFEAPDSRTVVINLAYSAAAFPKFIGMNYCAVVQDGTPRDALQTEAMGSGAFVIGRWDTGSVVEMEARADFWKEGFPYLDAFVIPIISDTLAATAAVLTGRLDRARVSSAADQRAEYERFVADGKGEWQLEPCNCIWGVAMNTTSPPFDNVKLRQAVNLALDRESHDAIVRNGQASVGLYQPGLWPGARKADEIWNKIPGWATGDAKEAELEQARQLVAEAGYPDGIDVKILHSDYSRSITRWVEWVSTQLPRVGIRVTADTYPDRAGFFEQLNNFGFELVYWAWVTGFPEPDVWIGQFFRTNGSSNVTGFSDPVVDELFLEQSATLDPQKRIELVNQIEDRILEQMPIAPGSDSFSNFVMWNHFMGYDNANGEFYHDRAEWLYDGRVQ